MKKSICIALCLSLTSTTIFIPQSGFAYSPDELDLQITAEKRPSFTSESPEERSVLPHWITEHPILTAVILAAPWAIRSLRAYLREQSSRNSSPSHEAAAPSNNLQVDAHDAGGGTQGSESTDLKKPSGLQSSFCPTVHSGGSNAVILSAAVRNPHTLLYGSAFDVGVRDLRDQNAANAERVEPGLAEGIRHFLTPYMSDGNETMRHTSAHAEKAAQSLPAMPVYNEWEKPQANAHFQQELNLREALEMRVAPLMGKLNSRLQVSIQSLVDALKAAQGERNYIEVYDAYRQVCTDALTPDFALFKAEESLWGIIALISFFADPSLFKALEPDARWLYYPPDYTPFPFESPLIELHLPGEPLQDPLRNFLSNELEDMAEVILVTQDINLIRLAKIVAEDVKSHIMPASRMQLLKSWISTRLGLSSALHTVPTRTQAIDGGTSRAVGMVERGEGEVSEEGISPAWIQYLDYRQEHPDTWLYISSMMYNRSHESYKNAQRALIDALKDMPTFNRTSHSSSERETRIVQACYATVQLCADLGEKVHPWIWERLHMRMEMAGLGNTRVYKALFNFYRAVVAKVEEKANASYAAASVVSTYNEN